MKIWNMAGSACRSRTRLQRCCTASEHSAVLGEGFHTVALPADGRQEGVPGPHRHRKIEGGNHADDTERMPLFVHAVLGALGMHGEAVQHARLSDREIGDVDHLLDFAVALGLDLAVLQGHEAAERVLVQAQFLAHQPHRPRRAWAPAPGATPGGRDRRREHMLVVRRGRAAHLRQPRARGRIDGLDQGSRRSAGSSRGCRTRSPD